MPTILTPQGWVKVADAPAKRRTVTVDPVDALKGPLAYFSCKRSPPKVFPGVLHLPHNAVGRGGKSPREAFPYDLNASPERLRAQGRVNGSGSQVDKIKIGGKNRTVSAPVPMHGDEQRYYYSADDDDEQAAPPLATGYRPSPPASPTRPRPSRQHEPRPKLRHRDDLSSVSSGSASTSTLSSAASSHRSHERRRPTQAYNTPAPAGPRSPSGPAAGYYNYAPPGSYDSPRHHHHPPPPSTGSGRSMSYSWYNATTPLNL